MPEQLTDDRQVCTPEHPMPPGASGSWAHTNVREIDCACDCCARYKCKDCGHEWKAELAQ